MTCSGCEERLAGFPPEERARIPLRHAAHEFTAACRALTALVVQHGWSDPRIAAQQALVDAADEALAVAAKVYATGTHNHAEDSTSPELAKVKALRDLQARIDEPDGGIARYSVALRAAAPVLLDTREALIGWSEAKCIGKPCVGNNHVEECPGFAAEVELLASAQLRLPESA